MIELIHPGEIIREEIEAREWTDDDMWLLFGHHYYHKIKSLMKGKASISEGIAGTLSEALGVSKQFFLNLQKDFDESLLAHLEAGDDLFDEQDELYP